MKSKLSIGIAEDHDLVRQGFVSLLREYTDIHILFEASNGKELLQRLKVHKPEMILLDIEMPVLGGIKAISEMKQRYPKVKIVVISAHAEPAAIIEYVKSGATAFLPKNCNKNELIKAIYTVHEQGSYFDEATSKILKKHGAGPVIPAKKRGLTPRETRVLKLLAEGKSGGEIAALLNITKGTFSYCKNVLLMKTNSKNLAELLEYDKTTRLNITN